MKKLSFTTKQELFQDINSVYHKHRTINTKVYQKYGKFKLSQIKHEFCNFHQCLMEYNQHYIRDIQYHEEEYVFIPSERSHTEQTKRILSKKQHDFQRNNSHYNWTYSKEETIALGEKMWTEKHYDFSFSDFIKYSNISPSHFYSMFATMTQFKQSLNCWNEIQEYKRSVIINRTYKKLDCPTKEELLIMAQEVYNKDGYLFERNFLSYANCSREHMIATIGSIKDIRQILNITSLSVKQQQKEQRILKLFETELKRIYQLSINNGITQFTWEYFSAHCDKALTAFQLKKHFGSFAKFTQKYNIKPFQLEYKTQEEVLQVAWDLYHKNGNKLNAKIHRSSGVLSQSTVDRLFGSFNNLLQAMGLPCNMTKHTSKEKILAELKTLFDTYGVLNKRIINEHASVSFPTVSKYCGSLKNIHKELGLISLSNNSISAEGILCLNLIEKILNSSYTLEQTFDWLVYDKPLKIDGYFKDYQLAIEYDGPLHFKDTNFYNNYEEHHIKDVIKTKLCKEHGIKLIRISHTEEMSIENLTNILIQNNVTNNMSLCFHKG